ncbi:MAG: sarcosine oxidase subunit alpha family protein [Rhodospirillaceae bacterium]|nr:sarcosine oxidase subunit alpha family protein [Rhodospirillaceae bacterium]
MSAGAQSFRLPAGGRIDRSSPVGFTFDGRAYRGYAGDTLASALLANGVHRVGRSFKYHRQRGILTAGAEEPNALVQVGLDRARTDPNRRATQVELYEGLEAQSQNRFPSLAFDLSGLTDRVSPLLPAGFYYKTFKWPAALWMTYERAIRHAAGQGRAPGRPDPDRYEHVHAHCDILVAGAGPAGLAAALVAARSGARVIVADEQAEFGGSLLSEPDGRQVGNRPATIWLADILAELSTMPEVRLLPRTTVFGYYDHNFLGLVERVTDHLAPADRPGSLPRQRLWKVRARRVLLATGAVERPLVFPDNDRPGILLAGSARSYLHRYAVAVGRRVAVLTNNDSAYRTAIDLADAGVEVPAIVDIRVDPTGPLVDRARRLGLTVMAGHTVTAVAGKGRVAGIAVERLSPDGRTLAPGVHSRVDCDGLCVSGGWTPLVSLFSQSRGRLAFDGAQAAYVPGTSVQAEHSAGACRGTQGLGACIADGHAAGMAAVDQLGLTVRRPADPAVDDPEEGPARRLWSLPGKGSSGRRKAFVDYQSDVMDKDLKLALREGYRAIEHVKRYTTAGMGVDQGKIGNMNVLGIVAEATGAPIPEVGVTTFRPPYSGVAMGTLAGRAPGRFLAPVRTTPMHDWHAANGAVFENVGQWKRPWYYRRGGETMREAVNREVAAARASLGMLDATTLGKIDVRGPDAAEFLNRVYTNAWSKLGVGRCRYGLMLGEDGMIKDDGVTTRLAEDHFHMTTTTGGAAAVLAWLEFWLQTEWPDLKVFLTSVTEQWAVISLCGPSSRQLLWEISDGIDLSAEAFPHMAMREGRVADIPARVFRISFTGELSYEVNVPAAYGAAAWEAIWTRGRAFDVTPYGTEAMHVLRAEKGFIIVGQETDGTVTPGDLGMDWIVSKQKPDFIGRRSLFRADTVREDRKQLVGLLTESPVEVLEEGAQIIEEEVPPAPPVAMVGHVTSAYHSPNLGRSIALALVKGGRAREGQKLYVSMPDRTIPVTITSPVFYDPEGARQNG